MEQIGYVRNTSNGMAEVEVRRISGCGGGCSNCGGSCNVPSLIIAIKNPIDAKPGDYVEIKAKSNKIIRYALIVYMIPFVMLILGIILSMNLFKSVDIVNYETYSFLVGLLFLGISFIIVKKIDNSIKRKNESVMEMVRILK